MNGLAFFRKEWKVRIMKRTKRSEQASCNRAVRDAFRGIPPSMAAYFVDDSIVEMVEEEDREIANYEKNHDMLTVYF
jgi:hypothetical protein